MEGVKRKDEAGSARGETEKAEKRIDKETVETPADTGLGPGETEGGKEEQGNADGMCKLIKKMPECEGVMVVSRNGKVEACESIADVEEEGVVIAFLGLFGERVGDFFGMGTLNRIVYGNTPAWKMVFKRGPEYVEIALKKGAQFNHFLASLKKTLDTMAQGKPRG